VADSAAGDGGRGRAGGGGIGAAQAETPARHGETIAKGTVFEDADGSGQRTAASKGVAGVMVSNAATSY